MRDGGDETSASPCFGVELARAWVEPSKVGIRERVGGVVAGRGGTWRDVAGRGAHSLLSCPIALVHFGPQLHFNPIKQLNPTHIMHQVIRYPCGKS
jgi:hypothetical protein